MGTCASARSTAVKSSPSAPHRPADVSTANTPVSPPSRPSSGASPPFGVRPTAPTEREVLSPSPRASDVIARESAIHAQEVTEQLQRIKGSDPDVTNTQKHSSVEVGALTAALLKTTDKVIDEAELKRENEAMQKACDEVIKEDLTRRVPKEELGRGTANSFADEKDRDNKNAEDKIAEIVTDEAVKEEIKTNRELADAVITESVSNDKVVTEAVKKEVEKEADKAETEKQVVAEVMKNEVQKEAEAVKEIVKKDVEDMQEIADTVNENEHSDVTVGADVVKKNGQKEVSAVLENADVRLITETAEEHKKLHEEDELVKAAAEVSVVKDIMTEQRNKTENEIRDIAAAVENEEVKEAIKEESKAQGAKDKKEVNNTETIIQNVGQEKYIEAQTTLLNEGEPNELKSSKSEQITKPGESVYVSLMKDNAEMALESMVTHSSKQQTSEDLELYEKYPELQTILADYYKATKYLKTKMEPVYFEDLHKFLHDKVLKPFTDAPKREHRSLLSYHMAKIGFAKATTAYYKYLLDYCGISFYTGGDDSLADRLICLLRELTWRLSMTSVKLGYKLGLSGFLELITDDLTALKKYLNVEKSQYAVQSSLGILLNCAKSDSNRQFYRELHVAQHVMPFIHSTKTDIKATSALILASVVDERHSSVLDDVTCFTFITQMLARALTSDGFRSDGYSAVTWSKALLGLASIERYKSRFVDSGALDVLYDAFELGGIRENRLAALAVWSLAFDDKNRERILKHNKLVSKLEELSQSEEGQTALAATGALWVVHHTSVNISKKERGQEHIFITYNLNDFKLVNKIKEYLEKSGVSVWIGNNENEKFDDIITALDGSTAVLACITDRYKDSPRNRSELMYAQSLGIAIIPLLVQRGYTADGWLADVIKEKMEYDFSGQYTYDENMEYLLKELRKLESDLEEKDKVSKAAAEIVVEISSPSHTGVTTTTTTAAGEVPPAPHNVQEEEQKPVTAPDPSRLLTVPVDSKTSDMERSIKPSQNEQVTSPQLNSASPIPAPRVKNKARQESVMDAMKSPTKELQDWTDKEDIIWLQLNKLDKAKKLYFLSGEQLAFLCNLYKTAPEFFYNYVQNNLGVKDLDLLMNFSSALGKLKT